LGFLGSAIAAELARGDFELRTLSRSNSALPRPWNLIVGDASDRGLLLRACDGVDHIVYAAGGSLPAESEADPLTDLERSLRPLMNAIGACARFGCGLTILSSGGTVYGQTAASLVSERHPTNPVSAYGMRNLVAEKYVLMQAENLGFPARILRIGNAYGSGQPLRRSQGIVAALLRCLARDEPFSVFGDGQTVRDYVNVADIASAAVHLLRGPPRPRVVNVGTGLGHSVLDLISICNAVTGRQLNVRFEQARNFDVGRNVLDIGVLCRLIDYHPTPLESGIARLWSQTVVGNSVFSQ
jgi:UDP-glucose 4-epimerase